MRRFFICWAISCYLVASSPGQMLGPPYATYAGIPANQFDFFAAAQRQSSWCWAASIQMILNWYGLPVDQSQVVSRTYGAAINAGASDQQISSSLNTWAIAANGRTYAIGSVTAAGAPQPSVLVQEMNQRHPILLTFSTGPFNGHAVVVTATTYFSTPQGPQLNSLSLRDPWPSDQNIANKGKTEVSGAALDEFLRHVRSHWLVSVHPISTR